jgi:hypothetical protein
MLNNNQSYWDFGLCPSFGILTTKEHNVSETESISVLQWGVDTSSELGSLERANLNHCDWIYLFLRDLRDPVSETLFFLVSRIPTMGKVQNSSNSEKLHYLSQITSFVIIISIMFTKLHTCPCHKQQPSYIPVEALVILSGIKSVGDKVVPVLKQLSTTPWRCMGGVDV